MLEQVALQVLQALEVLVELSRLAVGHEHDAVRPLEHEAPRGVVVHLARDGVELEPGAEARNLAQVDGQEVEEERAVGLGCERHHLPAP